MICDSIACVCLSNPPIKQTTRLKPKGTEYTNIPAIEQIQLSLKPWWLVLLALGFLLNCPELDLKLVVGEYGKAHIQSIQQQHILHPGGL